ncbi:MAG: zinc-dependent metalloprotease [Acidimicrobiales bacterium]|nr:zinc-dependent metalloprotease [Acidimicrobiales bacterium]
MSDSGSSNPEDPFSGLPFFADLGKLLGSSSGPVNWDAARQFALGLATDGGSEPNVDPTHRVKLADLSRIAELHVAKSTDLDLTVDGASAVVVPVTRSEWARRTLADYKPLFESLAQGLNATPQGAGDDDPAAQLLGGIMKMIGPMTTAMSIGSMVGHLAARGLGGYDLPIPRPSSRELMVVDSNVTAFATEWSVPFDDVALWMCIHEFVHHALFGVEHVRERFETLLNAYTAGFQSADGSALEAKLGDIEPTTDLAGLQQQLQSLFGDPEVLLGAMRTPAQEAVVRDLEALLAVAVGWVDYQIDHIATGLIASSGQIAEAIRRRRVTAGPQDRFVEKMLGLDLRRDLVERGRGFVSGVIERSDHDQLAKLWHDPRWIPTPNEVDAPGLWLARIELPDLD